MVRRFSTSRSRWWGDGASLLGGVFAAFVLGEGIVRLAAGLPGVSAVLAASRHSETPASTLEDFAAKHRDALQPHGIWRGYSTNRYGFYDTEFSKSRLPGSTRVVAIGDSFLFGSVPFPDTVMARLEDGLRSRCGSPGIELLNLGVPGAGPDDYLELARVVFRELAPDVAIIHLYLGNDVPGPENRLGREASPFVSYLWRFLKGAYLHVVAERVDKFDTVRKPLAEAAATLSGGQKDPAFTGLTDDSPKLKGPTIYGERWREISKNELSRLLPEASPSTPDSQAWQQLGDALGTIAKEGADNNVQVAFVFLPSEFQINAPLAAKWREVLSERHLLGTSATDDMLPNRRLESICREKGLRCYDTTPALRAEFEAVRMPLYIQQDTHWNLRGNRIAAEAETDLVAPWICSFPGPKAGVQ